jgi:hypothetical protein
VVFLVEDHELVVELRSGQLVTVGLHWVTVMVLVRVEVWVVVESISELWANARATPVARTVRRLLNCILTLWEGRLFVYAMAESNKRERVFSGLLIKKISQRVEAVVLKTFRYGFFKSPWTGRSRKMLRRAEKKG